MPGKENAQPNPAAGSTAPTPARSIAEIEADINKSRDALVQNIERLERAVKLTFDPKRIISIQVTKVRSFYIDEYGGVKPERVAITVGVVVSVVVLQRVTRRVFGKGK